MVVTASMLMGFGLLVVLGVLSALVYRGDVPDEYAWLHSDALRLSAEDTARLQALLDTIIEAQVRQRCLAACPTCGSRVDAPAESRDQPASSDPAG
jgi:hypothetical protein